MPTAKALYKGDGAWKMVKDFSDTLKTKLRGYYPNQEADTDPVWGHPADDFVSRVLAEAQWAISELHWHQFVSTKQEIRAEQADLLKSLHDLHHKLRSLSPDFERLMAIDADPLGCADDIKELIRHVECVAPLIDKVPSAKKQDEKQHRVMVEMSIRVLRVLKDFGIEPAVTGDNYFGYTSDAVKILKVIGDDIGLVKAPLTWRDTISEAKQAAPDLNQQ
jgi:hypothetical protein